MNNKRILVLHSDRQSYEFRLKQIENNPDLDGMLFRHCCVKDNYRHSSRIEKLRNMMGSLYTVYSHYRSILGMEITELLEEIMSEEVTPEIEEQITSFNPDVVIIHGGIYFRSVPDYYLRMVAYLIQKHPDLRFALQGKKEWLSGLSEENKRELALMREAKANFIDDDEIEKIIERIF